jgi:hypothetical protein
METLTQGPIQQNLTYEERSIWGTCQHCGAKPGEKCVSDDHMQKGEGVHFIRLVKAPKYKVITFHS